VPSDVILALDQGSSSTRCIAYDRRMRQRGTAVRRVSTHRPSSGMVEHDADELLAGTLEAISEVVVEVGAPVAGIGIASQTESFVLWERGTGRSVTPVVSWQDQRAGELCASIGRRSEAATIRAKTGLVLDPTFSAPKLAWLADPEATARGIATLAAEAAGLLDGVLAAPEFVRQVAPCLDAGGRARERSRWEDALDVHMRVNA
jgi:glycerol kinase